MYLNGFGFKHLYIPFQLIVAKGKSLYELGKVIESRQTSYG